MSINNIVAINQPYLFPYIGYFQLIKRANYFVFYDDVQYIKGGYINRNYILQKGEKLRFTVPLVKASSNELICRTKINFVLYNKWKYKFLKTLNQCYSKAPHFEQTYHIVEGVVNSQFNFISELAIDSVKAILTYLNISIELFQSSETFEKSRVLDRADRIIYISKLLGVNNYINPMNGQDLYRKEYFFSEGIKLNFLQPKIISYEQGSDKFIPYMSIIDVLMNNSKDEINDRLMKSSLI